MPYHMNGSGSALTAPEHVNFFYGLLLDEVRLKKEELYFNQKRWMLNRLVLGTGVVCGLNVVVADKQNPRKLLVEPGIALDVLGREIVVPALASVDPLQLTDDNGNPSGNAQVGVTEVCIAYAESFADPVPVLVADCEHPGKCVCSTVREGFHLLVRQANSASPPPPANPLRAFPHPPNGALQGLLSKQISAGCGAPPADPCVPLARITIGQDNSIQVDPAANRPIVYDNPLLYQLILSLSESVSQLGQGRFLRYFSGDGQSARAGKGVPQPLVVELVDATGQPVSGDTVQFKVTVGDGSVSSKTVETGANGLQAGQAQVSWKLGSKADVRQQVTASAVGSVFSVTFSATAT